jgi:ABC-type sugar transport system ATPase subunit
MSIVSDNPRPAFESGAAVLEARAVSKSFPGVKALDGVDFSLKAGEVHALCGENGAGKSTLMRVLAGNTQPDLGCVAYAGQEVAFRSPKDARQQGILLVHQEISLVPQLSVAENIFLGSTPRRGFGLVDRVALKRKAREVLKLTGALDDGISDTDLVGSLSIAKQQMVEIARAIALNPSVVIFDEPTASLTFKETEALFRTIRALRDRGIAIVYISHKMAEVFELSDRITVLRDGKTRGTVVTAKTSLQEVTRLMIGRDLEIIGIGRDDKAPIGQSVIRLQNFSPAGSEGSVDFEVRQGEIVGLYGLVGAGRSELAEAIFGVRRRRQGTIFWRGEQIEVETPREAVDRGIALVPEDRKKQGLVLGMGAAHNICLPTMQNLARLGFNNVRRENELFETYKASFAIKVPSGRTAVGTLSGGNQQKIALAKWLAVKPKLLILDEPTRGIDIGAKSEIYAMIRQFAVEGMAIILISSEMPEIIGLSHRILAVKNGRITQEFGSNVEEDALLSAVMT